MANEYMIYRNPNSDYVYEFSNTSVYYDGTADKAIKFFTPEQAKAVAVYLSEREKKDYSVHVRIVKIEPLDAIEPHVKG